MLNFLAALSMFSFMSSKPGIAIPEPFDALPKTTMMTNLSSHSMLLSQRYDNASVNNVFRENILLSLSYLGGGTKIGSAVNWSGVEAQKSYQFTLQPGETFAFHDAVLPTYSGRVVRTSNSHFVWSEGYTSDGYLTGDGVCHFASLINWAAHDAKLDVVVPTNHNFASINEIPASMGVAIYYNPNDLVGSAKQNLYITNNQKYPVTFHFDFDGDRLTVSVDSNS